MEKMYKIIAKAGASVDFEIIGKDSQGNNFTKKRIHINGGNGVFDQKYNILRGAIATWVTESELLALESLPPFKRMKEKGFIFIIGDSDQAKKVDINEVSEDMADKDGTAQWTKKETPAMDVLDKDGEIVIKDKTSDSISLDAPEPKDNAKKIDKTRKNIKRKK